MSIAVNQSSPRKWRWLWIVVLALLWLLCQGTARAGPLTERLAQFPDWQSKPPVQAANGDLAYPAWMRGNWIVTSTLVDLQAPLAPEVVTPGFESNRQFLDQPVAFPVRFVEQVTSPSREFWFQVQPRPQEVLPIVADRAFNGLSLAQAYLGDRALSVKVDPNNPNRQITRLRGDRQLTSTVSERATETPDPDQFVTTEIFQQVFRGAPQVYLNEVETTTAYHHQSNLLTAGEQVPWITADQVTAIYLSPQDPDYFKTVQQGFSVTQRPVALYRYRLEFLPNP